MNDLGSSIRQRILEGLRQIVRSDAGTRWAAASDLKKEDAVWHCCHPIGDLRGAAELERCLLQPLRDAFPDIERRADIFIKGAFNGCDWIATTGYYFGNFVREFVGIPAHDGWASLRSAKSIGWRMAKSLRRS